MKSSGEPLSSSFLVVLVVPLFYPYSRLCPGEYVNIGAKGGLGVFTQREALREHPQTPFCPKTQEDSIVQVYIAKIQSYPAMISIKENCRCLFERFLLT